jgi:hypothetical protein
VIGLVKRIYLVLDDDKFAKLLAKKGNKTWEEFLIDCHLSEESDPRRKEEKKRERDNQEEANV